MTQDQSKSKRLAAIRTRFHPIASLAVVGSVILFQVNLLWYLAGGLLMGLFGGKIFCRWFCPMGWVMEKIAAGAPDERARAQLSYYKLGCPVAWGSGLANRFSLFKIKNEKSACISCGLCDKSCYITAIEIDKSLYREGFSDPAENYACSKCLACVSACPTGALSLSAKKK